MRLIAYFRRGETSLWALAVLFMTLSCLSLSLIPAARAGSWVPDFTTAGPAGLLFLVWGACAGAARWAQHRRLPSQPTYILPVVYILSGWGLVLITRLAPAFGLRQTIWLLAATGTLIGMLYLPADLRWLRRYRYSWLLGGLTLTTLTLLLGVNPSGFGQRLWLGGGGLYIQPAEILKLLLVVFLAAYLSEKRELLGQHGRFLSTFLPLVLMWGFSMVVLLSQRDLGMGSLFFAVFLIMLYLASGRRRYVSIGLALMIMGAGLGYVLFDVVRIRVQAWWNPWDDAAGRSYQIVQSLIAFAAGGVGGRGPGLGAPTLVPVAHSDFIFAALAEEWGLWGLIAAVALLAGLVALSLRIAAQAAGPFRQLLAAGLAALTGVQALMIMGGVIKLIPLTGLTLPFLSYGGSSLMVQFVMVGLLLKIAAGASAPPAPTLRPVPIPRLATLLLAGFVLIAAGSGYWAILRRDSLLARPDNPRRALAERRVPRGPILDRSGRILAESIGSPGNYLRHYPYPDLAPVLGYISPQYGTAGVEAAEDAILHGDAGLTGWELDWREALGQPRPGRGVQLTLDLQLQSAADTALGPTVGSIVVLEVGTGDILALASHPTFDPNTLEANWETLVADPHAPLLNRATLALYQPGGALAPVIIAAALQARLADLNAPFPEATSSVGVGPVILGCREARAVEPLTLAQAFQAGCPWPIAELGNRLGATALHQLFVDLRFFEPLAVGLSTAAAPDTGPRLDPAITAIGQGDLTITPLQTALMIAGLARDGQVPVPRLIAATQTPQGLWEPAVPTRHVIAALTPEAARQVKALMPTGWSASAVSNASGQMLAWQMAFTPADQPRCAIVVLLENNTLDTAREMAETVLSHADLCRP